VVGRSLLTGYESIWISPRAGASFPPTDLVHRFHVPAQKPRAGGRFPWSVLVPDAQQFSGPAGNSEVDGEAPGSVGYCSAHGSNALWLGFPKSSPHRVHTSPNSEATIEPCGSQRGSAAAPHGAVSVPAQSWLSPAPGSSRAGKESEKKALPG